MRTGDVVEMRRSTMVLMVIGVVLLTVFLTVFITAWLNPDVSNSCIGAINLTPPEERYLIPDHELNDACPGLDRFSTPSQEQGATT